MRFFVLHPIVGSEAETSFEAVGAVQLGEAPRCPQCGLYVGLKQWLPPYRVRLRIFGRHLGDVAFDSGGDLLVSERFLRSWRCSGLEGLTQADPATVVAVRPPRMAAGSQPFFRVVVGRGRTAIDLRKSKIVRDGATTCSLCGGAAIVNAILALSVDEETWSGEDIFTPWGLNGIVIVTERVPALAADRGLANVTTTPVESYRWDPLGTERA